MPVQTINNFRARIWNDTIANLNAETTIPEQGELLYETDGRRLKCGDNSNVPSSLPYLVNRRDNYSYDLNSSSVTHTLSNTPAIGDKEIVLWTNGGANTITINPFAGHTINGLGAGNWVGRGNYGVIELIYDSANVWRVLNWEDPNGWENPNYLNSWANFGGGFQPLQYKRDLFNKTVTIRGSLQSSAATAVGVFVLPVGYRPAINQRAIQLGSGPVVIYIQAVATGGAIEIVGYVADVHINFTFDIP